jgi:hypothetical protein
MKDYFFAYQHPGGGVGGAAAGWAATLPLAALWDGGHARGILRWVAAKVVCDESSRMRVMQDSLAAALVTQIAIALRIPPR